jgi:hypothetical protein
MKPRSACYFERLNGRFPNLPTSALWRELPLTMETSSGRNGHTADLEFAGQPPFIMHI